MATARKAAAPKLATEWLTVDEVAARLGCSAWTVRRRISDGTIPVHRFGPRFLRVSAADVDVALVPVPNPARRMGARER